MKELARARSNRTAGVAMTALALGSLLVWFTLMRVENPIFEGRRVSSWFKDLCSGVFGGTPRSWAAYSAFSRIGPEAVPYLTTQLRWGRSGPLESMLLRLKNFSLTAPFMKSVILPSARRAYATVALRQMRGSAEAAIPALLEAWARDQRNVKGNAVTALAAILYGKPPEGMASSRWNAFESRVLADAARRSPGVAQALGIKPNDRKIIGLRAANRSQPIGPRTNGTSVAAGSGR